MLCMPKTFRGFSLFEIILYLGLFSLLTVGIFGFALDVSELRVKNSVSRNVFADVRFVSERLNAYIRNAGGIDEGASSFGSDFGKLVLEKAGSSDTVTIEVQDGRVAVTETGKPTAFLHSSESRVDRLSFLSSGSKSDGSEFVGFTLSLVSAGSGGRKPSQYEVTTTVDGGAFIRESGL